MGEDIHWVWILHFGYFSGDRLSLNLAAEKSEEDEGKLKRTLYAEKVVPKK